MTTHTINFSMFIDGVRDGSKRQTIRRLRKRPIAVGDTLRLYTGQRTKHCEFLREEVCTYVVPVQITGCLSIWHDGWRTDTLQPKADILAVADGFDCWSAMRDWFDQAYGLPFDGAVTCWGDRPGWLP